MLWRGFEIWQEHIENAREEAGGGSSSGKKPGQRVTAGDRRAFEKFKERKRKQEGSKVR